MAIVEFDMLHIVCALVSDLIITIDSIRHRACQSAPKILSDNSVRIYQYISLSLFNMHINFMFEIMYAESGKFWMLIEPKVLS